MKFRILLLISMLVILFLGCSKIDDKPIDEKEITERYFQLLKVNDDLTFSGMNELSKEDLVDKDYYQFFYKKGKIQKIKSFSSISISFHELNKYIFNVHKEWKEILISSSPRSKEYTFVNNGELVKFIIAYNDRNLPVSFQVLPFNIDYDNFNILSNSVVFNGNIIYNDRNLIDKITWFDSNAEYRYNYDKKNRLSSKEIYKNNVILYEYRFSLNKYGTVDSIK